MNYVTNLREKKRCHMEQEDKIKTKDAKIKAQDKKFKNQEKKVREQVY
jgi:hypothetical protein